VCDLCAEKMCSCAADVENSTLLEKQRCEETVETETLHELQGADSQLCSSTVQSANDQPLMYSKDVTKEDTVNSATVHTAEVDTDSEMSLTRHTAQLTVEDITTQSSSESQELPSVIEDVSSDDVIGKLSRTVL